MIQLLQIGVVGYCPPTNFDAVEARRMVIEAYDQIEQQFPSMQKMVVSGLTNVGVLAIAYEEAVKRCWRTKGVACKLAKDHPLFPVDEQVVVGDSWGDESERFLQELDCIVRIGGGPQSMKECKVIRDRGHLTFEYDLPAL